MRGILVWAALAVLMSVVGLQPAALASTPLRDIGMGSSMKERLIAAPSTLTSISTVPAGLVFGPVGEPTKDGRLVYKVILGPSGYTVVNAVIAGRTTTSIHVGDYPLAWAPAAKPGGRIRIVTTSGERMVTSSGGSQPSDNSPHPSYGNLSGWCCSFELQLGQDLTSWNPLTNQMGGSTTASHADLKGGVRISDTLTLVGGAHLGYSRDNSWSWRDNAASNSVLLGPLVGLRWQANPQNRLEIGASYDFVVQGDPSLGLNPLDLYASWVGDHGRWYHRAKISSLLPASSNGMQLELGARPLEQLPQLNVHVLGQGRQLYPKGRSFDPAKDLRAQWGGGIGFDVTNQVTVDLDLLAPSQPGETVAVGSRVRIDF